MEEVEVEKEKGEEEHVNTYVSLVNLLSTELIKLFQKEGGKE